MYNTTILKTMPVNYFPPTTSFESLINLPKTAFGVSLESSSFNELVCADRDRKSPLISICAVFCRLLSEYRAVYHLYLELCS